MKKGCTFLLVTLMLIISLSFKVPGFAETKDLKKKLMAELELFELERQVVFAVSKRVQSKDEAPAIVTTFTAQQLNELGIRTIEEALKYIAGFEVFGIY